MIRRFITMPIMSVLTLALLCVVTSCNTDSRAKAFSEYIIQNADSLAHAKCTEEVLQQYLNSYREDPELFNSWIDDIESYVRESRRDMIKYCKVIHILDKQAGRELPFSEAYEIIMALPDSSANIDSFIELQRQIYGINGFTENYIIWNEAKKYEKKSGH